MPAEFSQLLPSNPEELQEHIAEFERWFVDRQKKHGMEGGGLISVEHAILRSYVMWLRTTGGASGAPDQAQ